MRNFFAVLILLCSLSVLSQTETKPVKKGNCDFQLIADTSLLNKEFKLVKFSTKGLDEKNIARFNSRVKYVPGQMLFISQKTFEKDLAKICKIKKYKLVKIRVERSREDRNSLFVYFEYGK